jgi:hypothetical protein
MLLVVVVVLLLLLLGTCCHLQLCISQHTLQLVEHGSIAAPELRAGLTL